jgi:predicted transcriptional regulator
MEEEKQYSYYMVIPAEVWLSETLSNNAKLLFGHLQVFSQKEKYCFAGNKRLSKIMKVSENTIIEYLKELDENGFITRQLIYKENSKQVLERRIFINVGIITRPGNEINPQPLVTKTIPGLVTKTTPDNTTSINTNSVYTQPTKYEFTTTKEQIKINKAECDLSWKKLLSVWQTNEFPNLLKKIKKEYWDCISTENRQSILTMLEEFSSDKEHLQKIWISDCFKNKKMNSVSLRKEIEMQKSRQNPKDTPGYLKVDPDWKY